LLESDKRSLLIRPEDGAGTPPRQGRINEVEIRMIALRPLESRTGNSLLKTVKDVVAGCQRGTIEEKET